MLDKRCRKLLEIINNFSDGSNYKVFDIESLVYSFPDYEKVDSLTIKDLLKVLCERDFISVMYEDDKEICLKILPRGRAECESQVDENIMISRKEKNYFMYSFFGGFSGALLVTLIFLIILLIRGI